MKHILRNVLIFSALTVGTALACDGNACGDLRFSVDRSGYCHTVTNAGSRTISIRWGEYGPTSLAPGQAWTVMNAFNSRVCQGSIAGGITANYQ
jgi:hypothetical protein